MLNPHHAPTLASLAARVYCGDLPSNRIASATSIPPSTIKSLVSKIPVGLPFDNTAGAETLRVYRAGLASLGHKTKSGIYTSFELRSSIFDACTGKTSCVAAEEIYGRVPFSKPYQNRVICDMWNTMTSEGVAAENLARVVKKSWEVTGLSPFVSAKMLATIGDNDTDATKAYRVSLAAATRLVIPLMDAARAKESKTALAVLEQQRRATDVGAGDTERFARVRVTVDYVTKAELDDDESAGVLTNVTKFVISQAAYAFATTSVTSAGT